MLDADPAAAGWEDQRWTLARVRDLIAAQFKVQYTVPGTAHALVPQVGTDVFTRRTTYSPWNDYGTHRI